MSIYYIFLALLALVYVLNRENSYARFNGVDYCIGKTNKRKIGIMLSSLLLWLLMGLRAITVGTDTEAYAREYVQLAMNSDVDFDFSLTGEVGFVFLKWLFCKLGFSWQAFLFIMSLFISFSVASFISKYSANYFMGFYLYITIGMFAMNMTGLRQSLAVGILLFAFEYGRNKKLLKFILCCILAGLIHYASFVFLPIFLMFLFPYRGKKQLLIGLLLPIAVRLLSGPIYFFITRFALRKYVFSGYFDNLNYKINILVEVVALLTLLICYLCLMLSKKEIKEREYHFFLLTGAYVACIELSYIVYMAARLSFFFVFFMTTLLGNVAYGFENKRNRYIVLILIFVISFLQFIITIPDSSYGMDSYSFFWNA